MQKDRKVWIDILNIIACMGVLLLHSTNGEVHNFTGEITCNWLVGLLTHSFFFMAGKCVFYDFWIHFIGEKC